MALHLSFTLDPELAERVDIFAKKQELERNEALLRLIEGGLVQAEQAGIVMPPRERSFKETLRMQKNIDMLVRSIDELKKEVRVMHHLQNLEREETVVKHTRRGFFKK
ncbi:MAG TPA: type II secretion system protein E [Methanocorpusculum sp.]|nr:type II secretion system protein E [Methanocorpusculum sp.]HJJ54325.1 type II secretion system protein E [Methanocorpusculum sp.]HKL97254.1 type II secretion system protein E [Methanocorpusculum sp.]